MLFYHGIFFVGYMQLSSKFNALRACAGENQKIFRNMESWGLSKSLEASTKLKLLLGETIVPNFSV